YFVRTGRWETEAINNRAILREAKNSRSRIPFLRQGSNGSDPDVTEAESLEETRRNASLVESRSETEWIRKGSPKELHFETWIFVAEEHFDTIRSKRPAQTGTYAESTMVHGFGINRKEDRPEKRLIH